jgi:hypothetical protein
MLPVAVAAAAVVLTAGCGRNPWHTVATPEMRVRTVDIQPTHNRSVCQAFQARVLPNARSDGATGFWDLGTRDPWWNTMLRAPHVAENDVWHCYYRADSLSALPGMLVRHRDGADYRATVYIDGSGEWVPALTFEED